MFWEEKKYLNFFDVFMRKRKLPETDSFYIEWLQIFFVTKKLGKSLKSILKNEEI